VHSAKHASKSIVVLSKSCSFSLSHIEKCSSLILSLPLHHHWPEQLSLLTRAQSSRVRRQGEPAKRLYCQVGLRADRLSSQWAAAAEISRNFHTSPTVGRVCNIVLETRETREKTQNPKIRVQVGPGFT
jgi:hypothetical protein